MANRFPLRDRSGGNWRLGLVVWIGFATGAAVGSDYDPLAVSANHRPGVLDLEVADAERDRKIPIRVYLPESLQPETPRPAPVVLFSHGLGGSRTGCHYLGEHWSARGYVCVFLQHSGSDSSVWREVPVRQRMQALKDAASLQNTLARLQDVPAVLNQMTEWNQEPSHPLGQRMDLDHVGMSGHSFGAVTTQGVSGQAAGLGGQRFTDHRIRAAIAFSPSSPRVGDPARAFRGVQVPWMLMTGTHDTSPINDTTVESRLAVYPALPTRIPRYELVLHNAEHSAFSDSALPGDRNGRNPNHHRAILALSTAFWDTWLRDDPDACEWLHGAEARQVLQPDDRWQLAIPRQGPADADNSN